MRHAAQHPFRSQRGPLPVTPAASSNTARRWRSDIPGDAIQSDRTYTVPGYREVLVLGRDSEDDKDRAKAVDALVARRRREA